MKKVIFALLLFWPGYAFSQTSISGNADYSHASTEIDGYNQTFDWYFRSVEVDHQFKNKFGISGTLRKEGREKFNGTYITASVFRSFGWKYSPFIVSAGALYGSSGVHFDRSVLVHQGQEVIGYKSVFVIREVPVPGINIRHGGILQPIGEVKFRQYIGHVFTEVNSGVRVAKFGEISSDYRTGSSIYKEVWVAMPSIGLGIGITF